MRGWQINNFMLCKVQWHLFFFLASDQEKVNEKACVDPLKKIKVFAHWDTDGYFCSNRHEVIHIHLQIKAGRHIISHKVLSNHPYCIPSPQILSPFKTFFSGTHIHTYTHNCKLLWLVGKTKNNGDKDSYGWFFFKMKRIISLPLAFPLHVCLSNSLTLNP